MNVRQTGRREHRDLLHRRAGDGLQKNFPKGAVIVWELYPPNFRHNKQENGRKFPEFYRAKIKTEENFPGFRDSKQGDKRKCFGV